MIQENSLKLRGLTKKLYTLPVSRSVNFFLISNDEEPVTMNLSFGL